MTARIQLPGEARRGDIIDIRVLVQHPMETGYRYDDGGKLIPRNTIRSLVCRYAGVEIFRADMTSGIAANPYLQFSTIAEASGEIELSWQDDQGVAGSERQQLVVSG